jgi:mono/diheme cytochrome c family protein
MKDTFRSIMFVVLVGLPTFLIVWVFFLGCGAARACTGTHLPEMTSVPTLHAATMPPPLVGAQAVASTPKCHIAAADLIGAWIDAGYSETASFAFNDSQGTACTGTFKDDVQPLFLTPNIWYNGAQACTTCHNADLAKAFKHMDLSSYAGILAGANRDNGQAKGDDILGGGHWDQSILHLMLVAPGGKIQPNNLGLTNAMPFGRSSVVPPPPANGPVIAAGSPGGSGAPAAGPTATSEVSATAASGPTATLENTAAATTGATTDVARPSNPGGAGLAVTLTGNAQTGKQLFAANCAVCHGAEGKGGIPNPGSGDGTVPSLNPIDPTLVSADPRVFIYNLDLFLEHGSTPEGDNPTLKMPAWGDDHKLEPQQIADLIAYVMSLNSAQTPGATPTP